MIEKLSNLENTRKTEEQKLEKQQIAIFHKDANTVKWWDKGSGAKIDGSIYWYDKYAFFQGRDRHGNILKDFRLLGDRACTGYSPCGTSLLVKDISDSGDVLKRPDYAYPVYIHRGFFFQVTWWKLSMNAVDPSDRNAVVYHCIGDIITYGYINHDKTSPNLEPYRCVKEQFLEKNGNTRSWWSNFKDSISEFFSRLTEDQFYLNHANLKE